MFTGIVEELGTVRAFDRRGDTGRLAVSAVIAREGSDIGVPLMISEPESPAARAFMAAAERTAAQVSIASYNRPTISLTVVR